jgi:hypothetical protein
MLWPFGNAPTGHVEFHERTPHTQQRCSFGFDSPQGYRNPLALLAASCLSGAVGKRRPTHAQYAVA